MGIIGNNKIVMLLLVACSLGGCAKVSSEMSCQTNEVTSQVYVDIEKENDYINQSILNVITSDYNGDNKSYTITGSGFTSSDKFFYGRGQSNYRIDLKTGLFYDLCSEAGCNHKNETCLNNAYLYSWLAYEDGVIFVDGNKVKLLKDNSMKTICSNAFSTKFTEEEFPDYPDGLSFVIKQNDSLYVFGPNFYFEYNLDNDVQSEAVELGERIIASAGVSGGDIYYTNDDLELFAYNIENKTINKIADKIGVVQVFDDTIFYVQWINGIPSLYKYDTIAKNHELIVEECYVTFSVYGDYVFYQNYNGIKDVHRYDMNKKEDILISLEYTRMIGKNGTTIISNGRAQGIYSAPYLDHFFIIDDDNKVIYVVDNDTLKYSVIDLKK